MSYLDFLLI